MDLLKKNLAFLLQHQPASQAVLARAAGVTQPQLGRILKGTTPNPGYRAVQGLAHFFNVALNDLVERDLEAAGPAAPSQSVMLDPEIMSSALVTVDKALRHFRVDYGRLYEMPEVLIFAYEYRQQQPRKMTPEQYRLFDQVVMLKMEGGLGNAEDTTRKAGGGRRGKAGEGAAAKPQHRAAR